MPIELKNVFYTYNIHTPNEKDALNDISTIFNDNCFTALIGRTGSGKSTLIEHLNALKIPTSGIININNYLIDMSIKYKSNNKIDIHDLKKKHKKKLKNIKELRKKVGLVFQFPEYQLFADTVLKDVSYGPKNFNMDEDSALKASKEALSLVGLDESFYSRSPFELSGGEKRRVAIASILAVKPEILVLDEPTVGLDAQAENNLMDLLVKLHSQGTSIILATHNMDLVLKYTTRVLVLNNGKIQLDTTPLELFRDKEFLNTSSLQAPKVFNFALDLINHGFNINLEKIKDCNSLADEIIRIRGNKHD